MTNIVTCGEPTGTGGPCFRVPGHLGPHIDAFGHTFPNAPQEFLTTTPGTQLTFQKYWMIGYQIGKLAPLVISVTALVIAIIALVS